MVDIAKTIQYYKALTQDDLCNCNYCRNYYLQVKEAYPQVAAYLASLGIDIEKPFETNPLEPDRNGILEYCCCQYIVIGSAPEAYNHKIGDIVFRIASCFPSTGIQENHFLLEFFPVKLKLLSGLD